MYVSHSAGFEGLQDPLNAPAPQPRQGRRPPHPSEQGQAASCPAPISSANNRRPNKSRGAPLKRLSHVYSPFSINQCFTAVAAIPSNSAKICGESVSRPAERFSCKCTTDDVPGISRNVRRPMQQPRQRNLHRRSPQPPRHIRQRRRLQRRKSTERKERYVGYAPAGAKLSIIASSCRCARL